MQSHIDHSGSCAVVISHRSLDLTGNRQRIKTFWRPPSGEGKQRAWYHKSECEEHWRWIHFVVIHKKHTRIWLELTMHQLYEGWTRCVVEPNIGYTTSCSRSTTQRSHNHNCIWLRHCLLGQFPVEWEHLVVVKLDEHKWTAGGKRVSVKWELL